MIAFMPKIYEDELCYSWFARYYCHSGYPTYGYALDDLFGKRTIHFNTEFISSAFQKDARKIIDDMIPMETLILEHTMFPTARFMEHSKRMDALKSMVEQKGRMGNILPISQNKTSRFLRYCPICAREQRIKYSEAYWTRTANISNLDICVKHRCRLKDTSVSLSGKQSPRLYIAEQEIKDMDAEYVNDGLELQFASYLTKVFQAPINDNNSNNDITIYDFLQSKLEGTKYLCVSGTQRHISLLFDDFKEFYQSMWGKGIIDLPQMQKIFTGYGYGFYEVCQIAFFLKIDAEDLLSPTLPEKSQRELFNEKIVSLKKEGYGAKKIGKMIGASSYTVKWADKERKREKHNHSTRKGMHKEDWNKVDKEMLPLVKNTCKRVYISEDGTPGKVTINAICRILGFPQGRINHLPKCRNEILKYEESQQTFWARKVVWSYRKRLSEGKIMNYSNVCRPIYLNKKNFLSSFPFLSLFCEEEEEKIIKGLVEIY